MAANLQRVSVGAGRQYGVRDSELFEGVNDRRLVVRVTQTTQAVRVLRPVHFAPTVAFL